MQVETYIQSFEQAFNRVKPRGLQLGHDSTGNPIIYKTNFLGLFQYQIAIFGLRENKPTVAVTDPKYRDHVSKLVNNCRKHIPDLVYESNPNNINPILKLDATVFIE